jgi:rhodanese-related sulfurtransferase
MPARSCVPRNPADRFQQPTEPMKPIVKFLVVGTSAALVLAGGAFIYVTRTESGFRLYLDRMYRNEFPDVKLIEPDDLLRELGEREPPILIDTRSPEEFSVSHIRGAMLVDPSTFNAEQLSHLDRGRDVVVYCSIGYRSARIAERLDSLGFTNVRNLYGGIFLWYDQGRTVVQNDRDVQKIHPYSTLWGMFVTRTGKTTTPQ